MTIHTSHPDCEYCKRLWDWAFLDACFSNGIKVTDLDGFVERRDHYLVIETKGLDVPIPTGQQRMINSFARAGCFTVLIIWGARNEPKRAKLYSPTRGGVIYDPASMETIQMIVRKWYEYANTHPATERQTNARLVELIEAFRAEAARHPKRSLADIWQNKAQQQALFDDGILLTTDLRGR